MRRKLVAATVGVVASLLVLAPSALAAPPGAGITVPLPGQTGRPCVINGTVNGTVSAATATITRFSARGGQLLANGAATVTCSAGALSQTATQAFTNVPVNTAATTGSCQILDLVLGPLDLNLLGLVVHLDQVHLNITAQQGPGNLLGNLLCAVAGLLDNPASPAGGLAGLLNQILAVLGGL